VTQASAAVAVVGDVAEVVAEAETKRVVVGALATAAEEEAVAGA